jgi:hypothetical protein
MVSPTGANFSCASLQRKFMAGILGSYAKRSCLGADGFRFTTRDSSGHASRDEQFMISPTTAANFTCAPLPRKLVTQLVCHPSQFAHRLGNGRRYRRNFSCEAVADKSFMGARSGFFSCTPLSCELMAFEFVWK